jgi:hypothetical protein
VIGFVEKDCPQFVQHLFFAKSAHGVTPCNLISSTQVNEGHAEMQGMFANLFSIRKWRYFDTLNRWGAGPGATIV